jgi:acylphosphatase
MVTKEIIISGKVQGVFFRASAKETADRLGITGTVCNLQDGSVKAVASGLESSVEKFVQWCRRGPARARVESVNIKELPYMAADEFVVIRDQYS